MLFVKLSIKQDNFVTGRYRCFPTDMVMATLPPLLLPPFPPTSPSPLLPRGHSTNSMAWYRVTLWSFYSPG